MSATRTVRVTETVVQRWQTRTDPYGVMFRNTDGPTIDQLRQFLSDAESAGFKPEDRVSIDLPDGRGRSSVGSMRVSKSVETESEIPND